MMSVVFISFYATTGEMRKQGREEFTEKDVPFFLHFLFNKMNMLFSVYGKLDICWDGPRSTEWRKSIYPLYKLNREERKSHSSYQILMNTIPKIKEALNYYPCRQIEVVIAEADDIIFALAEKYNEPITVITGDGDLAQLRLFFGSRIELYHPIKKAYFEPSIHLLEEKAIVGDNSDNIKGLFRIGPKTFEKMMDNQDFFNEIMNKKDNRSIFNKLLKIVDLREFPYKQEILDKEKTIEYSKFQPDEIELFYWDNGLKDLMSRWSSTRNEVGKVK